MALASGVALATLAAASAHADTADGVFESDGVSMRVISAMAFRGKSMSDQRDAFVVAISNGYFRTVAWVDSATAGSRSKGA